MQFFKLLRLTSLKTRVTLLTLAIFISVAMAFGFHMARLLRADMQRLITAQQFSTSETLASIIEGHIVEHFAAMEQVASVAEPHLARGPAAVQQVLDRLPVFQRMFNGGVFITNARGVAIASWPETTRRVGVDYADRDYIRDVLSEGRRTVGRPVVGKALGVPVLVMAVPLRNTRGQVTGVLCGVINLSAPSFLDNVHNSPFGETGTFILVSPRHRMVITSSEKQRMLETIPPPGVNPAIDRFVDGFQGTTVLVNPLGVEVLSSVKQIPSAGWYLATAMPTAEVFAPARELERRMLVALGTLLLLGGGLTWWMIRGQLAPLQQAAETLTQIASRPGEAVALDPLPVRREDEIGKLIASFNRLMAEIDRQRTDLAHGKLMYSTVFQTIPDVVTLTRAGDGQCLAVNAAFTRVFGWQESEAVGRTLPGLGVWRRTEDRQAMIHLVERRGRCENMETELVTREGKVLAVEISASMMEVDGQRCLLAVTHDISARKLAQRQIETLAFTDPLTGLPNRRLLTERLSQSLTDARQQGHHLALIFIDLDDFKRINDSQGHEAGDKLLRSLASELRSAVRLSDTVARMGGDEFVVLLRELHAEQEQARRDAVATGRVLMDAIESGFARLGRGFHGSASIGIAMAGPQPMDAHELMRHADLAMYHAKDQGPGQVRVFESWMLEQLSTRAEMEASLRAALGSDQFFLQYQPQVGPGGQVLGAEALVRWRHPTRGLVPPAEFIPLAERSGLIMPLGRMILRTACQQLAQWAGDPQTAALRVSVNVSSVQFQQPDFVEQTLAILQETGANPHRLVLELTESLLVDSMDSLVVRMQALKILGVGFSLDDFGTGFSSLAYLQRLPLDELKIDASFVRSLVEGHNDLAIARMIVALGNTLGLRVLAEGVETEAQQTLLASIGCEHYQGFLFGKPEAPEALAARFEPPAIN